MKIKAIIAETESDLGYILKQEVFINGERRFKVYDLSECPEDAIIGRDLFDAYDYIDAIKFGMQLANEGYTDIEVE